MFMTGMQEMTLVESLKGEDLLSLDKLETEEVTGLIELGFILKKLAKEGRYPKLLSGKILGMIFEKHSTRTRISFESGMIHLGGHAMFMNSRDLQIGRGESVRDTAHVLSGYLDAIMIRANRHTMVQELADEAAIPVINGLTDIYHPCQALADLLTIREVKGGLEGRKIAYVGDGNNVAHSLILAAAHAGMEIAVATPEGYEPSPDVMETATAIAGKTGGHVSWTSEPDAAVDKADAVYTDVWTSMGQEEETAARVEAFKGFMVDDEMIARAKPDFMFLHCLPAHRGEEVAASVIDGPNSHVFRQAENRLHAQKAVLASIM
ncbi:ornithine carbamoyltransferase [Bhargavaea cecembensis]|uniref:ornithine carbamoyltransferase n=1 Tax=Bhargavaea cecembensis TaxID=394098 RepID=UPI000B3189DF|nr:ornithine carbamoyltransferase [Bhargavaea cecembensis]